MGMGLTLRSGSREYFYKMLDEKFPGLKKKYMETYQDSYELLSPENEKLTKIFTEICDENQIVHDREELFRYMREYKNKTMGTQLSIFDFIN